LDFDSPCLELLFSNRHKLRENTFVLVCKFSKKLEYLGQTQDAQNVCSVAKGGTILNGGWVPGISRGFHYWQPVPRLNNTPMAGTSLQPSHKPPCKETGTHHTEISVQRLKGGRKGGRNLAEETSWQMLAEKLLTLPETYTT